MSIEIKTRLNDGIYKSRGGGETRTHYTFSTGPRNLVKAAKTLQEHAASMKRGYGNIGCGKSWLEIDGTPIHLWDLMNLTVDDPDVRRATGSKTEAARTLIEEVHAGEYDPERYQAEAV